MFYAFFILLLVLMTSGQCQETAENWFNKGTALGILGNYDEAIMAFDEAIKLNPSFDDAWFNKGLTLDILRKYNESIAAYD